MNCQPMLTPSYAVSGPSCRASTSRGVKRSARWLGDHRRTIAVFLYTYAAMKQELFFNTGGIVTREGVAMALPERAVLDSFYFGFLPDIDDPSKLNKTRLLEWAVFYPRTVQNKAQALL